MEKEQDVTRREFLKTAATVTAASSLTGPGAPGILNAQSTGNPVRYGFIGTGTEGCNLLKFLATIPEGRCIATCDIYPPNLRSGDETCTVLLVAPGGESSDEAVVCQYAVADRWTAASVGIAEAAAPKKTIPLSSRNGELSERAGFGCRGDRLSGPGKGRLGAGGTVREKNPARRSRLEATGCILATAGSQKTNSGYNLSLHGSAPPSIVSIPLQADGLERNSAHEFVNPRFA